MSNARVDDMNTLKAPKTGSVKLKKISGIQKSKPIPKKTKRNHPDISWKEDICMKDIKHPCPNSEVEAPHEEIEILDKISKEQVKVNKTSAHVHRLDFTPIAGTDDNPELVKKCLEFWKIVDSIS